MSEGIIYGLGGVVFLFAFFWLYYTVKQKAKRGLFFKKQYEEQLSLTQQDVVFTTSASVERVRQALAIHIPLDDSVKGAFLGGRYKVKEEANRLVYERSSSLKTAGEGDAFTGSVTFVPQETGLRAVARIERWREKDGVTRRAGIDAMRQFIEAVKAAFREADPNVQIALTGQGAARAQVPPAQPAAPQPVAAAPRKCFCGTCGTGFEPGDKFCQSCGAKLQS